MRIADYIPSLGITNHFYQRKLRAILGDGDAIILVPYSDGMLVPKRGYYEKHLVGNLPGYKTDDGDIFTSEGIGEHIFYFGGVPVALALNPSEHSAVLDPLKAMVAHKRDQGEFIRVDQQGNTVEVGEAVAAADGGQYPTASEDPTDINYEVHDGLFDLTPKMIKHPETGDIVDQADGWVISQAKAAELVPTKTSSSEIALMQQRERNAMADASQSLIYALYGAIGASVLWLIFMVILAIATGNAPSVV